MPDTFAFADTLGPEKILEVTDPRSGLRAVVVVDNTACGPAIGGCRMAPDVSVDECFRLARAMTFKNAAAGLPHGGGKSVIFADPCMPQDQKDRLLRSFARSIREVESYIVGPDMGTNETAMAVIRDEIGRAVGLPREIGGIPLDEIGATGHGIGAAAEVAQRFAGISLRGARVAIQGYGAVGRWAARNLADRGAVIVAASDSRGGIHVPDGLDPRDLDALKSEEHSVRDLGQGKPLVSGEIIGVDCDILIPAARPDVINEGNVESVKARLILEGANIPATAGAEKRLHERGITVVPDFIANAGGVICASVEYHGGTQAQALSVIEAKITRNTAETLEKAQAEGCLPRQAATALARARVETAMGWRR